jgi:hypothetical protein
MDGQNKIKERDYDGRSSMLRLCKENTVTETRLCPKSGSVDYFGREERWPRNDGLPLRDTGSRDAIEVGRS